MSNQSNTGSSYLSSIIDSLMQSMLSEIHSLKSHSKYLLLTDVPAIRAHLCSIPLPPEDEYAQLSEKRSNQGSLLSEPPERSSSIVSTDPSNRPNPSRWSKLKRRFGASTRYMHSELLTDVQRLQTCFSLTSDTFDEKEDVAMEDILERVDERCKDILVHLQKSHLVEGTKGEAARDLKELVNAYQQWVVECDSLDVKERQRDRIRFLEDMLFPTGSIFGTEEPLR